MSFQRPKNPQTGMKQPQKAPTFYENSRKRRGGGGPRLPDMSAKNTVIFTPALWAPPFIFVTKATSEVA